MSRRNRWKAAVFVPLFAIAIALVVVATASGEDGAGSLPPPRGHGVVHGSAGHHPDFRPPAGVSGQAVIGLDERVRITDTTLFPWRAVAFLALFDGPFFAGSCSGTFIGPDTVLTAAHCLYDPDFGWTDDIAVVPGNNGAIEPFGHEWAQDWWVPDGWISSGGDAEWDWDIIKLPNGNLGNTVDWLRVGVLRDATLSAADFTPAIAGYPGSAVPADTMWFAATGAFLQVAPFVLWHDIDTSPGESGSAVFAANLDSPLLGTIVGIHTRSVTGAYGTVNLASRIDAQLLADLMEGCSQMRCSFAYYVEPAPSPSPTAIPTSTPTTVPAKSPTPSPTPSHTATASATPTVPLPARAFAPALTRAP